MKALGLSFIVSIMLFQLMFLLISSKQNPLKSVSDYAVLDFIQLQADSDLNVRSRQLPKEKKIEPKPSSSQSFSRQQVNDIDISPSSLNDKVSLQNFRFSSGPFLGNPDHLSGDGDVVPIVQITPMYPRKAAIKGIEGWVKLEFTITQDGAVSDVKILSAKPRRMFNRAAIKSILRWKFKPRIVSGKAVARRATQTIEFRLQK
jgi:periplasmic protein TonB